MRIVVTGRNGQVVSSLLERGALAGHEVIGLGRPDFDLADPASIEPAILAAKPDIVVSAAAYTAVDKAEAEADLAFAVNADGAGLVAAAAAKAGVPVIHLSTDYVFDGTKTTPYVETDPTGPTSVYGASKLSGEERVAAANEKHVILRVAWIYSPFGANFVKTMLRLAETRDGVRVVADQFGGPTSALDIADGILAVATNVAGDAGLSEHYGIFHMGPAGEGSWADLAEGVFAGLASRRGKTVTVERIGTADYPTPARRPANSRLDSSLIASRHGVVLPPWRESLVTVIDRLLP